MATVEQIENSFDKLTSAQGMEAMIWATALGSLTPARPIMQKQFEVSGLDAEVTDLMRRAENRVYDAIVDAIPAEIREATLQVAVFFAEALKMASNGSTIEDIRAKFQK